MIVKKDFFQTYFFVYAPSMHYNGPAIKGGCGTWRSHPATYPGTLAASYPGGKTGMACFLPIQA
jgi:hypothetical protein